MENVYKQHPGFDGQASPMMGFEASSPRPLPDALRGESWAFVALPLVGVREEIEQVKKNKVFGDVLEIDPNLPDDTLVPGIAVYTSRAAALAGWTKGLELGGISVDLDMGTLILDTGVADSWQYARFRQTKELTQEAREWEQVKQNTGGAALPRHPDGRGRREHGRVLDPPGLHRRAVLREAFYIGFA